MASTGESKREGGGRRWEPRSDEEQQRRDGEFKQAFFDEYRKRHGDAPINAEQTWELFMAVKQQWRAKKMERRQEHERDGSPRERRQSPGRCGERRQQMFAELQTDFQKDFAATHGSNTVNADQAWALIQQVKRNKREKWRGQKHGRHDE